MATTIVAMLDREHVPLQGQLETTEGTLRWSGADIQFGSHSLVPLSVQLSRSDRLETIGWLGRVMGPSGRTGGALAASFSS